MNIKSQTGYALFVTLIILFVLTVVIVSQYDSILLGMRSVAGLKRYQQLFYCANEVLIQAENQLLGESMHLSSACGDLPIQLSMNITHQRIDQCGNKVVDIQATALVDSQELILQARDIFARVPPVKGCERIPRFRRIGWCEGELRECGSSEQV